MKLEAVTKDRAPMDDDRKARIAEVWHTMLASGAADMLWRYSRFEAFLPGPRPHHPGALLSADEMNETLTMERIVFYLDTPRGSSRFDGVPVLCEGVEFGKLTPP